MSAGEGRWSPFRKLSAREEIAAVNTVGYDIPCKFPGCERKIPSGGRMLPLRIRREHERVAGGTAAGQPGWWTADGWQCLEHAKD